MLTRGTSFSVPPSFYFAGQTRSVLVMTIFAIYDFASMLFRKSAPARVRR